MIVVLHVLEPDGPIVAMLSRSIVGPACDFGAARLRADLESEGHPRASREGAAVVA
ncbi:MAG: hypothetical protein AB1486_29680 [Planctomycetota bacterium]